MVPFAYFGIKSSALSLIIDLLIIFLAILYVALVYWTVSDARRRIDDPMLVGCALAISLIPFIGTIVYSFLRPPEYLADAHERELETRAAEARVGQLEEELCPHCDCHVERDFVRCPRCLSKLKEPCGSCSRPLRPEWTICPYCEAEVPRAASSRTRRRRAREEEREQLLETTASEPASGRSRRSRRDSSRREASRSDALLEREARRERRRALVEQDAIVAPDAVAAPDVTLVDEALIAPEDLLGSTIEADVLADPSEEGSALGASEPSRSSREPARRARRTRPPGS